MVVFVIDIKTRLGTRRIYPYVWVSESVCVSVDVGLGGK